MYMEHSWVFFRLHAAVELRKCILMATSTKVWNKACLSDVVYAMDRLLSQAETSEFAAQSLDITRQIRQWNDSVRAAVQRTSDDLQLVEIPPFPVSKSEFSQFQRDIRRAVGKRSARAKIPKYTREDFTFGNLPPLASHESLDQLLGNIGHSYFTSWLILGGLVATALFNILVFVLVPNIAAQHLLILNLVCIVLLMGIWSFHRFHALARIEHHFHLHVAFHHPDVHRQ